MHGKSTPVVSRFILKPFVKLRFLALVFASSLTASPLWASWQEETGFNRLKLLAAGELPNSTTQGLTQVEALESPGNYTPDITSPLFLGKTFDPRSGTSAVSGHAQGVATNFYGNASQLPGSAEVHLYSAGNWLEAGFLQAGTSLVPNIEPKAVQNHSWVGGAGANPQINRRLDFAIDRDGFVCAVGVNNGDSNTPLPELLCQSYHTISVGLDSGAHSSGPTTYDGINRTKPDIVAPGGATSWATPIVAGAAGLLHAKASAAPYSLTGADRPRVIKALLLASATKDTVPDWGNTSTRPLDDVFGAGELNIHHAYHTLRAGQATAGSASHGIRGWAADSVSKTMPDTYLFTIPAGEPARPFCAAITWHRTISSEFWSSSMANLNLHLLNSSGTIIAASQSTVDNVELVYQTALTPGTYSLVVRKTSGSDYIPYALA